MWQSTNANHRFYEMEVNPDKEKRPIEIYGPQLDTEDWHLIEEYDYPLTNHPTPLPKRITGWWYRISPRVSKILLIVLLRVAHMSTGPQKG